MRRALEVVLAAVATPLAFGAYLLVLGYGPAPEPVGPAVSSLDLLVVYVGSLAGLGLLGVVCLRAGLRWVATAVAVSLVALPWVWRLESGISSFFDFNMPALFVLATLTLVAAGSAARRHPERARNVAPPRVAGAGLLVGVGLYVVAEGTRFVMLDAQPLWALGTAEAVAVGVLTAVGVVLLGAVPTVLLLEHRLLTPALVVAGLFGYAWWWTYDYATSLGDAASGLAMTLLTGVMVGWFAVLALALAAGSVEWALRTAVGRYGGRPVRE